MALLDITTSYQNGEALLEADLDAVRTSVTTFINTTKLNDDNFQANNITGSTKLLNSSVTTAKIADQAITDSKINNDAVTTVKIVNDAVTTAKIPDLAITTAKLLDNSLLEAKFADASVTPAKRADVGEQQSATVNFTTTSAVEVDVTNATVTITTTGKSVMLYLNKLANTTGMGLSSTTAVAAITEYYLYRDATKIAIFNSAPVPMSVGAGAYVNHPASGITHIDEAPAAGTYTYKVAMSRGAGSAASGVIDSKLVAYEIV